MVEVRKNPPPEAVRQSAQHVLFVEGQATSIDREAMHTFLGDLVRIEPLGSSFHLANAAQALYPFHAQHPQRVPAPPLPRRRQPGDHVLPRDPQAQVDRALRSCGPL